MVKKANLTVEQYCNGSTLHYNDVEGALKRRLVQNDCSGHTIGELINEDINRLLEDNNQVKLTVNIEFCVQNDNK